MEVLADLVIAAVFKTVGLYEKHAVGGFDSHALPLLDVANQVFYRPVARLSAVSHYGESGSECRMPLTRRFSHLSGFTASSHRCR